MFEEVDKAHSIEYFCNASENKIGQGGFLHKYWIHIAAIAAKEYHCFCAVKQTCFKSRVSQANQSSF